jgi:hypothetical protein
MDGIVTQFINSNLYFKSKAPCDVPVAVNHLRIVLWKAALRMFDHASPITHPLRQRL